MARIAKARDWHTAWCEQAGRFTFNGEAVKLDDGSIPIGEGAREIIVVHSRGQEHGTKELLQTLRASCRDTVQGAAIFVVWLDGEVTNDEDCDAVLAMHEEFLKRGADDVVLRPTSEVDLRFGVGASATRFRERMQAMQQLADRVRRTVEQETVAAVDAAVARERSRGLFWEVAGNMFKGFPELDRTMQDDAKEGAIIGPGKLLQNLGHGSFGTVFRSDNIEKGTTEAVKFIAKSRFRCLKHALSLWDEIRLHGRLEHPNVARQLGVMHGPSHIVVRMEDAGGSNLYSLICKSGRSRGLPPAVGRKLHGQILNAVAYCHGKGVAHRDLKPENIVVDADSAQAKMVDFGCCVRTGTPRTDVAGSVPFIAPEVYTASPTSPYEPAGVDVWACGVLLLEMLCGINHLRRALAWDRSVDIDRRRSHELAMYLAEQGRVWRDARAAGAPAAEGEAINEFLHGTLTMASTTRWCAERAVQSRWARGV